MDIRWKRVIEVCGILLILPGLGFGGLGLMATILTVLISSSSRDSTATLFTIAILAGTLLTLGIGIILVLHAQNAIKNKPSGTLRLPHLAVLIGIFITFVLMGLAIIGLEILPALFFPPIFIILAVLPPLWAVSWFTPRPSLSNEASASQLSWRRGLVAFCGGATMSVVLAIILEITISLTILSMVYNASNTVINSFGGLFQGVRGADGFAKALTAPSFVYFFVLYAIIAPLVEELVKPLVTLPLLRHLNKQETFWVGALAGAGFAAVENVLYASGGFYVWAGILVVRALGGALHPLGSGLVALGWREMLLGKPKAFENWFKQYGLAVLIHALWNGGSLIVVTLGSAQLFNVLPAYIDILGLSMAGTTLLFLLLLGLAALWLGRSYGHNRTVSILPEPGADNDFILSERASALWALTCLLAFVPIGIAGLRLWLR